MLASNAAASSTKADGDEDEDAGDAAAAQGAPHRDGAQHDEAAARAALTWDVDLSDLVGASAASAWRRAHVGRLR